MQQLANDKNTKWAFTFTSEIYNCMSGTDPCVLDEADVAAVGRGGVRGAAHPGEDAAEALERDAAVHGVTRRVRHLNEQHVSRPAVGITRNKTLSFTHLFT